MTLPCGAVSRRRSQLYGLDRNRAALDIKQRLSRSHVLANDGSQVPATADDVTEDENLPTWLTSMSRDYRVRTKKLT